MVHFGPFWPEEVHFGPFRYANRPQAIPEKIAVRCMIFDRREVASLGARKGT